ncbi:MAG: DUF305 domain-containing protein [Parasphingopyxis sp.]|uniref:DUF305 domain-containing protein n=1 Tax=Parasphingopyxis sp. TaxID=1920299 RepID=UPI003F9F4FF2
MTIERTMRASLLSILLCGTAAVAAQSPTIVQPGAPGEPSRTLTAEEARTLARNDFAPADAAFMQNMIVHHRQAVEMSALVADRTNNEAIIALAGRIDASQADEISFMRTWLRERGEPAEMAGMGHMHHAGMAGMATPEQMERLETLRGTGFDRLFLELMTLHHQGALTMVEELLELPGTAADPVMHRFTTDIVTDQQAEIDRMNALLASLSEDPRAELSAGLFDAGEAISGLRHVAFLRKPDGFFDPANPAGLRPEIPEDEDEAASPAENGEGDASEEEEPEFAERGSLLSFVNTDIAFSGDLMIVGNYHGFQAYRLGEDGVPELLSATVCPGGQGDVSIAGNLLLMSVQDMRARVDCGRQGVNAQISDERFRGLRIFDISDVTRPRQVGQVQTCRGSHTHSLVAQTEESLIVYNSGTSSVRDEEELAGCVGDVPGDARTALFRIDVIEIPLADPAAARIVSSPAVFADAETGRLGGLWQGGDHGDDTQETSRTDQCHDITVFPALNIAAGACSGNGIIFDISDPMNPQRIDEVVDEGFAYWHSATFNNDGTTVLFTDEWGGGGRPRCQAADPRRWGANAFYAIVDGELEYRGTYKLPAPQGETENCVAHNGSIIPVPGRDIFVQAWYQGGISVIDFTDPANPFEIAYFDRGPVDADQLLTGGYWSAYWYNGRIYATDMVRGLDVFALEPGEHLSAAEIAAAEAAIYEDGLFNPQTQTQVSWPADILSLVEESKREGDRPGD